MEFTQSAENDRVAYETEPSWRHRSTRGYSRIWPAMSSPRPYCANA